MQRTVITEAVSLNVDIFVAGCLSKIAFRFHLQTKGMVPAIPFT